MMNVSLMIVILAILMALAALVGVILLAAGIIGKRRAVWIAGIVVLVLSVLGCACAGLVAAVIAFNVSSNTMNGIPGLPPAITAIPVPAFEATVEVEPSELPELETPEEPGPITTPGYSGVPAPGEGPWWVIATDTSLWAADASGSELTQVLDQPILFPERIEQYVSPAGGYVAFLTSSDPVFFKGVTLNLLSLSDGSVTVVTPLTIPDTEPADNAEPGDQAFEALRAISETESVVWSPDGTELAFTAALDQPLAELFVYNVLTGDLTKVSDIDNHVIDPVWSPDGSRIAFTSVSSLGTGAGYGVDAVWLADINRVDVEQLYDASGTGGQLLLGWSEDDLLVVADWQADCGGQNLRSVDVESGDTTVMWGGCFNEGQVAFDPGSGAVLFSVSELLADWNEDQTTGLAWADANSGEIEWLADPDEYTLSWWGIPQFFSAAGADTIRTISPAAEPYQEWPCPLPTCEPTYSNAGPSWAVRASPAFDDEQGLWVGMIGLEGEQVYDQPVTAFGFVPNTEDILFLTGEGIYSLPFSGAPELVSETYELQDGIYGAAWAIP